MSPSTLSLLGLVRHMAEVERAWFRLRFAGDAGLGYLYCSDEYPDGDFDLAEADRAAADFAAFTRECEQARAGPRAGPWTTRSCTRSGAPPSTCAGFTCT